MSSSSGRDPFSEEVRREAADWFARMRGPDADSSRPGFRAWRESDPAHAEAYERMLQEWERTAFLASTGVAQNRDLGRIAKRPIGRQVAVAASLTLVAAAGMSVYWLQVPAALSAQTLELDVVTADQRRIVSLDDDTVVTVSPRSALRLSFTPRSRRARLTSGRVRFDLPRPDPRPLVLEAGRGKVVASTGTFQVSLETKGVRIEAITGTLDAGPAGTSAPGRRRLGPGEEMLMPRADAPSAASPSATADDGMLTFEGQTVSEAVDRFNRKGLRRIAVDPTLGSRRVSGAFRADDPAGFARALVAMFGGRANVAGSGAIMVAATGPTRNKR